MKEQKDLVGLSSKSVVNQLRALVEKKPSYDMHGLTNENWFKWFLRNLANIGNNHYAYQYYANTAQNNGIFHMKDTGGELTVALLSDWASDTPESFNVARMVGEVDYSIHLGDTYYVGNYKEIASNFNSTLGGPWPYGSAGSFALLGNHEMYSSGRSYFTQLLPYMGCHFENNFQQQEASFFCLENDHWRIIGLDTGYDSLRGLLGLKPNYDLRLHPKQIQWLRDIVRPNADKRGLVFLSHHQYFSAFEKEYPLAARQISEILDARKTVLWLWGHEHKLALYGRNVLPNGSPCFSRCIGNGGMPVEINQHIPKSADPAAEANRNLVLYDNRFRNEIKDGIRLGHNGYCLAKLNDDTLKLEYYDDNLSIGMEKRLIFSETWVADTGSDTIRGLSIEIDPLFVSEGGTVFSSDVTNAVL